jgi:hypothetical protein
MRMGSSGNLSEFLAARSGETADAVVDAVLQQVDRAAEWLPSAYEARRSMPTGMLERILELTASGEPFTDADLDTYTSLGALFAGRHVPLPLLIASFDTGIAALTREWWRLAPAEHFAEMTHFTERLARMIDQTRQAAVRGYLEARSGISGRSARWSVAEELITGEAATAAAMGERLAPGYLVLACTVAEPALADAERAAAVYRHIEAISGALHFGNLSSLIILLPVEDGRRLPETAAAELVSELHSLTGQMVYAAQAYRPDLAGVPAAVEEACRSLCLVKAIPDAECRPYQEDVLLVELAIARQPDITQRLAALLVPLEAGSDLYRTLEVLFACDLDRERTAAALCIHRRTLRYRLDRIRDLSGIAPDSLRGAQLLRAALTAARLPATVLNQPLLPSLPGAVVTSPRPAAAG